MLDKTCNSSAQRPGDGRKVNANALGMDRRTLAKTAEERAGQAPQAIKDRVKKEVVQMQEGDPASELWVRTFVGLPHQPKAAYTGSFEALSQHLSDVFEGQHGPRRTLCQEAYCSNGRFKLCLLGAPGAGKTHLLKKFATVVDRPLQTIDLDGMCEKHNLLGDAPTYKKATAGPVISALVGSGISNPIIVLEEIDKIRTDDKGQGLREALNALLDDERSAFYSPFLGLNVDLSKVAFIATANNLSAMEKAMPSLASRLGERIAMEAYTPAELVTIVLRQVDSWDADPDLRLSGISKEAAEALVANYCRKTETINVRDLLYRDLRPLLREAACKELQCVDVEQLANGHLEMLQIRGLVYR